MKAKTRKRNAILPRVLPPGWLTREAKFDFSRYLEAWKVRRAHGKAQRKRVPRERHANWKPAPGRPDVVAMVVAGNEGRQKEFVPLRMGRMAESPFAFLRGAAAVMAYDLSSTPTSGFSVVMCGDAHLSNFGLYGTPAREVVFDLNDFDEAIIGHWEWDLKRLVASVNVAARENGLNQRERRAAVVRCVTGYRQNAERIQSMGVLATWYLHAYPGRESVLGHFDDKYRAVLTKAVAKARAQTNELLLSKTAHRTVDGSWRFREDPPVLTRVSAATIEAVTHGLNDYADSLPPERRFMLQRYRLVDVAHRIVGVGSVGTRAYLALLFGNGDDDPLFLQVKEAMAPVHGPYLPALPYEFVHEGKRVVHGQRALQATSDVLLGYTTIEGRPFYVRQMKNMKGSIPMEWLSGSPFNDYAWSCGAILARAHCRMGDAARIAGYCGNSEVLGVALASFAEAYGDQTERDHAALVQAIKRGRVRALRDA